MSICADKLAHLKVVINCWYSVAQMCTREDTPALIVSCFKLNITQDCDEHLFGHIAHAHVVINCRYSIAQLCTREDMPARELSVLYFDGLISYNSLTT